MTWLLSIKSLYEHTIISNQICKRVNQQIVSKCLIHGTKHHKDNQLQSLYSL